MGEIKKYIYLKNKDVRTRIEYVQGTNTIPIVLSAVDWDIPDSSEARIYVKKPSGKEVYNTAAISGNDITIQPTTQMFAEFGKQLGQVQIVNDEKIAATYLLEFEIEKNLAFESSAVESSDEYGVLDELIKEAQAAISDTQVATAQAKAATSAANNAAGAANEAANGADTAAAAANNAAEELQEKANAGDFSASITVGAVTTGEPGSQASVTNSGTNKDAVLDFTIPRGDTGGVENPDTVIDASTMSSQNVPTTEAVYDFVRAPIGDNSYIASPIVYGDWGNWYTNLPTGGYLILSTFQFSKSQPYMLTVSIGNDRVSQAEYRILVHFAESSTSSLIIDPRFNVSCLASRMDGYDYSLDYTQIPIHFLKDADGDGHIAFGNGAQRWMNTQVRILDISVLGTVGDENWKTDFRNDWGFACLANLDDFTVLKTLEPEDIFFIDSNLRKEVAISEETIEAFKALGWTPPVGGAVIESLLNLIFDRAHPVGSYYWSSDSTNPSKLFGGTWEQVTDKFVLAAGSAYKVGQTGGEATHILTIDEMPSHNHESPLLGYSSGSTGQGDDPFANRVDSGRSPKDYYTKYAGGGQPHNNMPPYEVAYCWRRTA